MLRYSIPLVLFLLLVVFLAFGLRRDPNELPSVLINKPAPAFRLPQLEEPTKTFSAEEEAFFAEGAELAEPQPESFDDLDDGYLPQGFWRRHTALEADYERRIPG